MTKYLDVSIEAAGLALTTLAVVLGSPALGLLGLVLAAVGFGMLIRDKLA
jgi:hypothetical protein